jgi:hypothetical protein
VRDVGPIDAVKESALLLKKTWGENLIGQAGLATAFAFIFVAVIFAGVFLSLVAAMGHSIGLFVTALVLTVLALGLTALVQSALAGIYEAALYRYATTGQAALGFDSETLQLAFRRKK